MNACVCRTAFALYLYVQASASAFAVTEIVWWHAMSDANRAAVEELSEEFNRSQSSFKVRPEYKGSYAETLRQGLAAVDEGAPPHVLQVVEVGTATMMAAHGAIKPIHEVMRDAREYFEPRSYLPAIAGYYSTPVGEMLSFPFNSSSAVLWINLAALSRSGIEPNSLSTWPALFSAAKKLQANGHPTCGLTSAWFTWIMLEQLSAWHNLPLSTRSNGLEGLDAELLINTPFHVAHLAELSDLQRTRAFDYSGRNDEGESRFITGECPLLLSSSGFYGRASKDAAFPFRASTLPYYPNQAGAPQNTIIGGASLWVMRGKTPHEYQGVARFFAFLSETQRQAQLHQKLGYLPVTRAAYDATRDSGFYAANPTIEVPLITLTNKPPTSNSKGVRLGDMVRLREVWAGESEAALRQEVNPQRALDNAVKRGNEILRRFEATAR